LRDDAIKRRIKIQWENISEKSLQWYKNERKYLAIYTGSGHRHLSFLRVESID